MDKFYEPIELGEMNGPSGKMAVSIRAYEVNPDYWVVVAHAGTEECHYMIHIEPEGTLGLECIDLQPDEFLAKTWGENEEIAEHILNSGFFHDTGRRVWNGYIEIPVWKYTTRWYAMTVS